MGISLQVRSQAGQVQLDNVLLDSTVEDLHRLLRLRHADLLPQRYRLVGQQRA